MDAPTEAAPEPAPPPRTGAVRISRRKLLGGAAAAAALVTAGGATAVVLKERGAGSSSGGSAPLAAGLNTPPDALKDADTRLRHLLRRTTFTATPADVARYHGTALEKVTDDILASAALDDSAADQSLASLNLDTTKPADVIATWVARMLYTRRPIVERMTLCWHGLLTSGLEKVGGKRASLMLDQNQFFRQHAFSTFDVLLKGVVRNPAMMLWLDLQTSRKGHPNENYARELMELFTLGAGNYSEQDVRESARAHTGYSLDRSLAFVFRPALHDDGQKTFLGQTGNFDADAVVDIILKQDAAPTHFARKIFEAFAYPAPDSATLKPIADVARRTAFDTKQVLRAVLTSDAFYSPLAYRALVKSPTHYTIGALRLFGAQPDPRLVVAASRNMGQVLFDPPNVAGWPGGGTWLATSTWFARVNFAAAMMNGVGRGARGAPVDTTAIFRTPPASAAAAVDAAALATIDGVLASDARQTLVAYLDEGGGFSSLPDATRQERLRGMLALLLASPDYQLA
ncbi:MAG TPA: DUF1800 domain-containing protein [Dehalococcoidia bacterium]|nr:DUF1800 domain-containing protein [Dehalococcoidia bacterium]